MKKHLFLTCVICIVVLEIAALTVFALVAPEFTQDTVAVNEVVQSVTNDLDSMDKHQNVTKLDYAVLCGERVIFRTKQGISESINQAIAHRDTVLDVEKDGITAKVIIFNDGAKTFEAQKNTVIAVLIAAIFASGALAVAYAIYMHFSVIKPFSKLRGFAERVAGGNLDVPLQMDKRNLFGAFTESFDIMRSELKKARAAEAQASESKKELVAKLSHDIRTPVASIKAVSEVGLAVTAADKDRDNYTRIITKADQINALVTNLFTATLEDLEQLSVNAVTVESGKIGEMLKSADYLCRAVIPDTPQCLVQADELRLLQVFDNIFANSYKYAATNIDVTVRRDGEYVAVQIEDYGGGVSDEELRVLKEKFRRGSNVANVEGAGLGLYISDYFMREMGGKLIVENGTHGLRVTVFIRLSGGN